MDNWNQQQMMPQGGYGGSNGTAAVDDTAFAKGMMNYLRQQARYTRITFHYLSLSGKNLYPV